jgi:hypothetical protein
MLPTNDRKIASRREMKQMFQGISLIIVLALLFTLLILGGVVS